MSAFEQLQRQLVESVCARAAPRRRYGGAGLARWWRARVGRGALMMAVPLACAAALAAGTLATRLARRPPNQLAPGTVAVSEEESACAPCRAVGGLLHAPLREETGLAGGAPARQVRIRRGRPIVTWQQPAAEAAVQAQAAQAGPLD